MAKAIDGSGAVDQAKMHAFNGKNITDMSFLNFTTDKPPSKAVCPHSRNLSWIDTVQRRSLWPTSGWSQRASAHALPFVTMFPRLL